MNILRCLEWEKKNCTVTLASIACKREKGSLDPLDRSGCSISYIFVLWVSFSLKETQLSFILNTIMWFFSFLIYSFKIALRILWSKRDPVSTSLTNQICQAVISISCLAQLRWQWDSGTHKKESQARRPASSHCTYIWSRWRGFWCSGRPAE